MKLAIIVVHYHTPELLQQALAAACDDVVGLGVEVESIVVDNGSTSRGRELLASLDAGILRPGANLGYAGALNLAVSRSDADSFIFMNPDVLVSRGCIPRLLDLLRDGVACAGPRFWWDRERTMLLPPTERRGLVDEGLRALAPRSPAWARRARRRWRSHALRHWRAGEAIASYDLSGGLLAVSRAAWEQVGSFDEGYRLYFEETDWLQRSRRAGLQAFYEPRAEAVHLFGRSAAHEPSARSWFAESEQRFRRRHFGRASRLLLEGLGAAGRRAGEARTEHSSASAEPPSVPCRGIGDEPAAWVELAAGDAGFPAAAARVDDGSRSWSVPRSIWRMLPPGHYTLQAVSRSGRELTRVRFNIFDDARNNAGSPFG